MNLLPGSAHVRSVNVGAAAPNPWKTGLLTGIGKEPATGPVQVVVMSRVDILDDKGRVLEHHDEFSFVPNVLSSFRLTEGPS